MVRFRNHIISENVQVFWGALQHLRRGRGSGSVSQAGHWVVIADGRIRPRRGRNLTGRCLRFAEREEIALAGVGCLDKFDRGPAGR